MAHRRAIPRATQDAVLREFNHRCAICGADKPQLHHIDEDHDNHAPDNLLPICPNCHLLDHHSPTTPADPKKVALFRKYKDPLILSPQFEPLFARLKFLLDLEMHNFELRTMDANAEELISFVAALEMGTFYGPKIAELISKPSHPRISYLDTPDSVFRQWDEEEKLEYFDILISTKDQAIRLVFELLRFQNSWQVEPGRDLRRGSR